MQPLHTPFLSTKRHRRQALSARNRSGGQEGLHRLLGSISHGQAAVREAWICGGGQLHLEFERVRCDEAGGGRTVHDFAHDPATCGIAQPETHPRKARHFTKLYVAFVYLLLRDLKSDISMPARALFRQPMKEQSRILLLPLLDIPGTS